MALKGPSHVGDAVQAAMKGRDLPAKDEDMKTTSIRLQPSDMELLKSHFRARGLGLSAGIRMIILDYMARNVR